MYESDITKFMREFLEKNPEVASERARNRATWWDKTLDLNEQEAFRRAREAKKGYAYFDVPSQKPTLD